MSRRSIYRAQPLGAGYAIELSADLCCALRATDSPGPPTLSEMQMPSAQQRTEFYLKK